MGSDQSPCLSDIFVEDESPQSGTTADIDVANTSRAEALSFTPPRQPHQPREGWRAFLRLGFGARTQGSFLAERRHEGPLRVQRPLYPEGAGICHAIVVHPPGGIAGGDSLLIEIDVGAHSHALLATPGATKWYRSHGRAARQDICLAVHDNGKLDWLPQNNIVFDGAQAELNLVLSVAVTASAIGWEVTQLGRQIGETRWLEGSLSARTTLKRPNGELLWTEQAHLSANDPIRDSMQGLGGWSVFGTLWAVFPEGRELEDDASDLEVLQDLLRFDDAFRGGLTRFKNGLVLIRIVAREVETLQTVFIDCWKVLRPLVHGVSAQPLRLWST